MKKWQAFEHKSMYILQNAKKYSKYSYTKKLCFRQLLENKLRIFLLSLFLFDNNT